MIVEWCRMMCKVNGEYVYHFFSIVSLPWIVELGVLFFFGISWVMLCMLIGLSECWKVRFGR